MTTTGNGGPQGPQAQQNAPQLNVLVQYIKDFSFENPNAPRSLAPTDQPPINIQINVNANAAVGNRLRGGLARRQGRAKAARSCSSSS